MVVNTRHKNTTWTLPTNKDTGKIETWDYVKIAVLMDLRDELQKLNQLLGCPNFTNIPTTLRDIERNTKKRKYVRRKP